MQRRSKTLENLIFLLVTISMMSGPGSVFAGNIDIKKLQSDSLQTLLDLIRIDTSQPQGNEYLATNYLKDRFIDAGIEYKIYESEPGRASIVARLKGNGSKKPILLLGHTDVVTVERENWTFDPFEG